jgi:prepilin-type N-terminal cleavage/methylation domain-containing protein
MVLTIKIPGKPARRKAFNLVELLVVIAILALLASLSGGTYMLVAKGQREKNTGILLGKLNQAIQSQRRAFLDQLSRQWKNQNNQILIDRAAGNPDRAFNNWVNQQIAAEFPTNFQEAGGNQPNKYSRMMDAAKLNFSKTDRNAESSACLLMVLSIQRGGQSFNPETALESGSVVDLDGDGLKEIRDAWGDPISFQRVFDSFKGEWQLLITSSHMP